MFLAISVLIALLGLAFIAAARTSLSQGGGKAVLGGIFMLIGVGVLGLGLFCVYRDLNPPTVEVDPPSGPPARNSR